MGHSFRDPVGWAARTIGDPALFVICSGLQILTAVLVWFAVEGNLRYFLILFTGVFPIFYLVALRAALRRPGGHGRAPGP